VARNAHKKKQKGCGKKTLMLQQRLKYLLFGAGSSSFSRCGRE